MKVKKLKRQTALKKQYLKYVDSRRVNGKIKHGTLTWAQWLHQRGKTVRTKKVEGGMKGAGLTDSEIAKFRSK